MGQSCAQLSTIFSNQPSKDIEDCLNLNIFTPAIPLKTRRKISLPVVIFIHGGFFSAGSNAQFSAAYILEHDIVLVVPNFRLDALGKKKIKQNLFDEFHFDNHY